MPDYISKADIPVWLLHYVQKHTAPSNEVQFDGGTTQAPARRGDNPTLPGEETLPVAPYMKSIQKAIFGIRESEQIDESSLIGKSVEHKEFDSDNHSGKIVGLHRHPTPGNHIGIVIKTKSGKEVHSHTGEWDIKESLDEASPPWLNKKKKDKSKDGDKNNDGKIDKEQSDENDETEKEKSDDSDKGDGEDEKDNSKPFQKVIKPVTKSLDGSEIKQALEQLALQAAEIYAEIEDEHSFDDQTKDEIDVALETLGKLKASLNDDESDEDKDENPGETPSGNQSDSNSPNPPVTGIGSGLKESIQLYLENRGKK